MVPNRTRQDGTSRVAILSREILPGRVIDSDLIPAFDELEPARIGARCFLELLCCDAAALDITQEPPRVFAVPEDWAIVTHECLAGLLPISALIVAKLDAAALRDERIQGVNHCLFVHIVHLVHWFRFGEIKTCCA